MPHMDASAASLLNGRLAQKKRTSNFREDETRLLIQLWGSADIQNKLYMTHRKEPVMRLLAHSMAQHGFKRTPDEIKTRIRNLKCLYHRIKRSVQSGAGFGTVDPDWPHYHTMDAILSKQMLRHDIYADDLFDGPQCDDIKKETPDTTNDNDMEFYSTNSMCASSDGERLDSPHSPSVASVFEPKITVKTDLMSPPPMQPKPSSVLQSKKYSASYKPLQPQPPPTQPPVAPNPSLLQQSQCLTNGGGATVPTIPFPLLILNSLQMGHAQKVDRINSEGSQPSTTEGLKKATSRANDMSTIKSDEIIDVLRNVLDVQRESLTVERERLALERDRFEFEKIVGQQILSIGETVSRFLLSSSKSENGITVSHDNAMANTCQVSDKTTTRSLKSEDEQDSKKRTHQRREIRARRRRRTEVQESYKVRAIKAAAYASVRPKSNYDRNTVNVDFRPRKRLVWHVTSK